MRAEEARAIAAEAKKKRVDNKGRTYEQRARDYAEKKFPSALKSILEQIRWTASRAYCLPSKTDLGVTVKAFSESGEFCEDELKNQLLADKLIKALREFGYEIELNTRSGPSFGTHPDYMSPTTIKSWIIKW